MDGSGEECVSAGKDNGVKSAPFAEPLGRFRKPNLSFYEEKPSKLASDVDFIPFFVFNALQLCPFVLF